MTRFACHTDPGPRENLEDSYQAFTIRPWHQNSPEIPVLGVLDGVGGQSSGEIASQLAASQLTQNTSLFFSSWSADLTASQLPIDAVPGALRKALERANQGIVQVCAEVAEFAGMAATAVWAVIVYSVLYVAWVGDSRCYVYHQGRIRQVTRDHSEARRLVELGLVSQAQAKTHPLAHTIYKYLGQPSDFAAETSAWRISAGDLVILCTDGLTDVLPEEVLAEEVRAYQAGEFPFDQLPVRLVDRALTAGTQDNVTVVCCEYDPFGGDIPKAMQKTRTNAYPIQVASVLAYLSEDKQDD